MILHLGFELPEPKSTHLDDEALELTQEETRIIKSQIRKNTELINDYVARLDLFVNKEKYPNKVKFVNKLRERLYLLMDENDTFRKVLWKHTQQEEHLRLSKRTR